MPFSVNGVLCTLALLVLWRANELVEACSCAPVHPQQAFCNADVVIRAKVVGEREVDSGNDIYGNPIKRIQYEVKQIKMFKGPNQDIEAVFTAPVSAVCGVTLDASGKKEYLISGKADTGGSMHVTLCDYIMPWDSLSNTQKKGLSQRYQMGCECKVRQQRTESVCECLLLLENKVRLNRPNETREAPQQQLQQQTSERRLSRL
ncbi:metalloproteinase inhibitor 2a [Xyrichtys novacula]|uniref:Metalloproteinase inhibitor 2 n=1 Tax=Xyrichtys novacula TaxID=13765 RepID=A0AAV1H3H6_XYRNO|nr:metalloproteinase inhibitor 2a [Xyrichtys novacula]